MDSSPNKSDRWSYLVQLSYNYMGWAFCWTIASSYMVPNTLLRMVDDSVKNSRLGLMAGASNMLVIILVPLAGTLSDRMRSKWGRRRPFYLPASLVLSILLLLVVPCPNYLALLTLLVLMHGALAFWFPNRALIRDIVPLQRRGRISGLSNITNTVGIIFAHVVSPRLIESGRMLTLALVGIMASLFSNLWVALRIKEPYDEDALPMGFPSWKEVYLPKLDGSGKLGWLAAVNALTQMGMVAMVCFLLYFIKDQIDPDHFNTTFGKTVLIAMAAAIPSSLGAGFVADRFGRKRVLFIACLLQVACILNFLLSPRVYSTLYLSGLLYGLGNGAYMSMYWTILSDMVPEGETGKYIGLMQYTFQFSWAIIPPSLGPIIDSFGAASGRGYDVFFLAIAVLLTAGVALIWKIPETLKKNPTTPPANTS